VKNEVNVFDKGQLIGGHLPAIAITIGSLRGSLPLVKETPSAEFLFCRLALWRVEIRGEAE
jgi:hypothetical protein